MLRSILLLVNNMKRYLRIYLRLLKVNFANFLAYRANFINSLISSGVWSTFGIVSMLFLTSRSSSVFGWSRNEILLLTAVYNILFSVYYCFFSENFEDLPLIVHLGRLDGLLLKPINTQFLISAWKIGYHSIIRFSIGIIFLFYLLNNMKINVNYVSILLFIFTSVLSIAIVYSIWFIVMTTTIWFSQLSNLPEFMFAVNGVIRYPGEIYKNYSKLLYVLFFPLTLVATIPVRAIIAKIQLSEFIFLISSAFILFYVSNKFFRFALRFYTSASG